LCKKLKLLCGLNIDWLELVIKKTTDRLTDHQICESDIYNWFDKGYSRNGLLD